MIVKIHDKYYQLSPQTAPSTPASPAQRVRPRNTTVQSVCHKESQAKSVFLPSHSTHRLQPKWCGFSHKHAVIAALHRCNHRACRSRRGINNHDLFWIKLLFYLVNQRCCHYLSNIQHPVHEVNVTAFCSYPYNLPELLLAYPLQAQSNECFLLVNHPKQIKRPYSLSRMLLRLSYLSPVL